MERYLGYLQSATNTRPNKSAFKISLSVTMKKLIDIPDHVHKALSHQAVDKGMRLKNYIEYLLSEQAKKG
jgi:macrodomain Ter protein organizer (MatP/YcbG family)